MDLNILSKYNSHPMMVRMRKGGRSKSKMADSATTTPSLSELLGLLWILEVRGHNLAIRDVHIGSSDPFRDVHIGSSDPYVVLKFGEQVRKTRIVKKDLNPHWCEDLTLHVTNPYISVKLEVFDHDTFTKDEFMGDVEFNIEPYIEALRMDLSELPNYVVLARQQPSSQNCLFDESPISLVDGKVVQNILLKLRNVECGEIELRLQWIDVHGCKGLENL